MGEWIEKVRAHPNQSYEQQRRPGLRLEKYHSVEMKPAKSLPIYQFKLNRVPDHHQAFVFVKPDSDVIHHLDTDAVLDMKYLPIGDNHKSEWYETRIQSISVQRRGPFKGFYRVGLSVAEQQ